MDGNKCARGLLTVSAEAEAWMRRTGALPPLPAKRGAGPHAWLAVEVKAARHAGRDWYDDQRAGYLLDCRRRGEDAVMASVEECLETWLYGLDYVPAYEGRIERALHAAFREGWDEAEASR